MGWGGGGGGGGWWGVVLSDAATTETYTLSLHDALPIYPQPGSEVWEIGPGLGAMTILLLEAGCRVTTFEIDRGFAALLSEEFGANPNFSLVLGDAVKTWPQFYQEDKPPARVMGNLPYASGSAILLSLIQGGCRPEKFLFTLQREVVQRILALPGDPNYSSFSILCQSLWDVKTWGDLKAGSFYPAPEVVSSLLEAVPHSRYPLKEEIGRAHV